MPGLGPKRWRSSCSPMRSSRISASRCSPHEDRDCCRPGQVLRIPISHGEGNFFADAETLASLEGAGRVVLRYCTSDGRVTAAANPNGSLGNIAGISNARGNVVGMMPHPERACEAVLGSEDGLAVFRSAIHALTRVAV